MNKVKVELKVPENKTIEYNGIKIEIIPYLQAGQQVFLINKYVEDYFGKSEEPLVKMSDYNYLEAEFNLINFILQTNTNIDTENLDSEIYVNDDLIGKITFHIDNYWTFRERLMDIVGIIKERIALKNSVGSVISELVTKAYEIINKFSDMNPEELEKMQKTGMELIERLEKSSVLGASSGGEEEKK